jgi:hypothetical protein
LAWTAGELYIASFIDGAITTGARVAATIAATRSEAIAGGDPRQRGRAGGAHDDELGPLGEADVRHGHARVTAPPAPDGVVGQRVERGARDDPRGTAGERDAHVAAGGQKAADHRRRIDGGDRGADPEHDAP